MFNYSVLRDSSKNEEDSRGVRCSMFLLRGRQRGKEEEEDCAAVNKRRAAFIHGDECIRVRGRRSAYTGRIACENRAADTAVYAEEQVSRAVRRGERGDRYVRIPDDSKRVSSSKICKERRGEDAGVYWQVEVYAAGNRRGNRKDKRARIV
jgi:hypothetical protein